MPTMEKTTLYLPSDLRRMLKEVSKRTGQPQAELVREALRLFLQQHARPPLRSLGVVRSKEITGRNAEDWLREHWHPR